MSEYNKIFKMLTENKPRPSYLVYRDISILTKSKELKIQQESELLVLLKQEIIENLKRILAPIRLKNKTILFDDGMSLTVEIKFDNGTNYIIYDDSVDRRVAGKRVSSFRPSQWMIEIQQMMLEYQSIGVGGIKFELRY